MAEVGSGFPEFFRNLERLSLVGRREILTKMAKAGGEILRDEMQVLAPVDTGRLRDSITTKVLAESSADEVIVGVGPDTKRAFWGHFQEFGTAHHSAQPFMNPALEARRKDIEDKMGATFWEAIPSDLK